MPTRPLESAAAHPRQLPQVHSQERRRLATVPLPASSFRDADLCRREIRTATDLVEEVADFLVSFAEIRPREALELHRPLAVHVAGDFRMAAVFEKHGIDFCCGGSVTLAAACAAKGLDPAALAGELEAAANAPRHRDPDYASWTLARLIDHITAIHHAYLKANTAQNAAYTRKIADVLGEDHPELTQIAAVLDDMAPELVTPLENEEEVVFPAIKRAEASRESGLALDADDAETIARGVEALVREHEEVGAALHDLRNLAMGYGLPADACATHALTYQRLQAFETDLHKHVHLENNILLPRATERFVRTV